MLLEDIWTPIFGGLGGCRSSYKLGETKRIIVGNLTARRDWSYVQDVVDAYVLLAEKGYAGQTYVIGTGKSYSIGEFIDRVKLMLSIQPPVFVSQGLLLSTIRFFISSKSWIWSFLSLFAILDVSSIKPGNWGEEILTIVLSVWRPVAKYFLLSFVPICNLLNSKSQPLEQIRR